jgi:hypothetical protein
MRLFGGGDFTNTRCKNVLNEMTFVWIRGETLLFTYYWSHWNRVGNESLNVIKMKKTYYPKFRT